MSDHHLPVAANVLDREFTADAPNRRWVGDTTAFADGESGKLYLAVLTVFVHHRVADYNTWRPEYDRVMTANWTKDIRAHRVWRGQDDPNLVIVATTFDSRQAAEPS